MGVLRPQSEPVPYRRNLETTILAMNGIIDDEVRLWGTAPRSYPHAR